MPHSCRNWLWRGGKLVRIGPARLAPAFRAVAFRFRFHRFLFSVQRLGLVVVDRPRFVVDMGLCLPRSRRNLDAFAGERLDDGEADIVLRAATIHDVGEEDADFEVQRIRTEIDELHERLRVLQHQRMAARAIIRSVKWI